MKVRFAVTLVGSALGFVLPAFADEAPTAASSTQDAISVDSNGPTGHPAIKDHHPKRPKKQHPKPSDEASSKSAPDPSSVSEEKGMLHSATRTPPTRLTAPPSRGLLSNTGITTRPSMRRTSRHTESALVGLLIPFNVDGMQQIFHIIPSVATDPNATSGPRTGLRRRQIYNLTVANFDLGQSQSLSLGLGPLLEVPTATSTRFRPRCHSGWRLRGHPSVAELGYRRTAGAISAHIVGSRLATDHCAARPYTTISHRVVLSLGRRHEFNTYRGHTTVIPVGIGFRQGVPAVWRLPVEPLCRGPTLPLSLRAGRANLQILAGHSR